MNARSSFIVVAALLGATALACTSQTSDNFTNPPAGPPSDCEPATVNPCRGGSVAYVCATSRPDDGDTNLVCDDGAAAALGQTSYCCAPFGQAYSDCAVDTSVVGCPAASFGFLCTGQGTPATGSFPAMGPETPAEADASLACSAGVAVDGGVAYCCNSEALASGCAADPTNVACDGAAAGYSCAAGQSPSALDPKLACTPEGGDRYCCVATD